MKNHRIPFACLAAAGAFLWPPPAVGDGPLAESVARLRDGDFEERNKAEQVLGDLAVRDAEAVFPELLTPALQKDPEVRLRSTRILRRVFDRLVLRVGATTINAEFGRFLWVYNDGRPSLGPIIERIPEGSLAAKSGLEPGDNIRAVDGRDLGYADGLEDLRTVLAGRQPGEVVHLKVWRVGLAKGKRKVATDGTWFECDVELEKGRGSGSRPERPGEFAAWRKALAVRFAE